MKTKEMKGITLIALVVTIVVLLILAGVSINLLLGENGIITKATGARDSYSKSAVKEKVSFLLNEYTIDKATGENADLAKFLRKNLQVGVAEKEDGSYSFILGDWQVVTSERKIISIEKFKLDINKTYSSVTDMKNDTSLSAGKIVKTDGYYNNDLSGGAYYDIVSTTSLSVDNATCIQLDNGMYAELHVINDTVSVNQFGAYGDGVHDDADAIQLTLNSGYKNISFENKKYNINNFITIGNSNVYIFGNNATLVMQDGFEFSKDFDWAIFIGGTKEKSETDIHLYNLGVETNQINFSRADAVQVKIEYIDNCEIYGCNFIVPTINEDKSRPTTNICINGNSKDVIIDNCNMINLSNSNTGGSVWISANNNTSIDNVKISNNYIEKSSHDETMGIWGGSIKNITINNNKFNIHEENVDNPSDMNFTFGNADGILQNLEFSDNEVLCTSKNYFSYINPADGSEDISIVNNNIKWTFLNSEIGYNPMFNNKSNVIIDINNNNIVYNGIDEDCPGIYNFTGENETYYNNKITINGKIQALQTLDSGEQKNNTKFDSNTIIVNTNIRWLYSGYYFCNNTVELNEGFLDDIRTIFRASFTMKKNMEISNNIINLKNNNYDEKSVRFLYCLGNTFNNYSISLNKNKILTDSNVEQMFIFMFYITDTQPQTVLCKDNSYANFKRINFYGNSAQHIVNFDGKEITSTTSLE